MNPFLWLAEAVSAVTTEVSHRQGGLASVPTFQG